MDEVNRKIEDLETELLLLENRVKILEANDRIHKENINNIKITLHIHNEVLDKLSSLLQTNN